MTDRKADRTLAIELHGNDVNVLIRFVDGDPLESLFFQEFLQRVTIQCLDHRVIIGSGAQCGADEKKKSEC